MHTKRRWLSGLLWLIGLVLIAATLIPIINSNYWWIRNFVFPQTQITVLIVCLLLIAIVAHALPGMKLLIAALALCTVYQLFYLLPYTPVAGVSVQAETTCPADRRFTLLEANAKAGNTRYGAVRDLVERVKPDLFFAVETDEDWQKALQPLKKRFKQTVVAPRDDYWAMMLFSNLPLKNASVQHLIKGYVPSIRAEVELSGGGTFVFHGLHPRPPMMHGSAPGDAEVLKAARIVAKDGAPALLTGDLNDVPWSSTAQLFQQLSGMSDPRVGRGYYASFDADSRIMRWPLDHIYVTPDFRVVRYQRLGDIGSDHFPMLATLCYRPETKSKNGSNAVQRVWRRARQIIKAGRSADVGN
ncbi:endonuclease/exonuclease/phosphatase family protein [Pararhizobium mangrovi]|uniref:Endonuclease n=1 Tax=Pararhizobium mangrovi TaxID=2590452 RepID=A0A506U2C0_9HYPH|nr:endonuclease/exonuclease/phosphatase family protein [Pararhizobium mangrovi]TPW26719.1 endonuclease [Pararhizobium mangrovi]